MAEATAVVKKTTKKDLEAELETVRGENEILRSQGRSLMEQVDAYWLAVCDANARSSEKDRLVGAKDGHIWELQSALAAAETALQVTQELNEGLERIIGVREAQQNFVLHVVNSITLYGGNNVEVVRGLAESILAECVVEGE